MKKPDDECLQEQTQNVFNNVTSYIQRKGISASLVKHIGCIGVYAFNQNLL